MHYRIRSQISSLDALFLTLDSIEDDEIKSHFSKYLCIKVSGLLENYIKSQIGDYVDSTCSQPTSKFVKGKLKTFTNIDFKKLSGFLESFDEKWKNQFDDIIEDRIKSSLNAIISNRNNIAHGNNDSITPRVMTEHYENLKLIINILDEIIKR
jgi:hypothetical protein